MAHDSSSCPRMASHRGDSGMASTPAVRSSGARGTQREHGVPAQAQRQAGERSLRFIVTYDGLMAIYF
jgi:hypothetical protein